MNVVYSVCHIIIHTIEIELTDVFRPRSLDTKILMFMIYRLLILQFTHYLLIYIYIDFMKRNIENNERKYFTKYLPSTLIMLKEESNNIPAERE